ncbi:type II secretion system protein [bacterium]|nr:type II secretion system protein [bacterium]
MKYEKYAFTLAEGSRRTGDSAANFGKTLRLLRFAGFTLAEVLITIGIIGVVAALTIPSLATNITHRKLKSQFEKAYSEVNQAARAFYADTDSTVHDYDVNVNAFYTSQVLEKFMSYYKSPSKTSNDSWATFDNLNGIKNLNLNGYEITGYPCDRSYASSDIIGRTWVMDDSSRNLDYGPKICIDINGIDKPNRWGYDRFVFVFTENNAVVPYTGNDSLNLVKQMSNETSIARYCRYDMESIAHTCAYFALRNISPTGNGDYWNDFLK